MRPVVLLVGRLPGVIGSIAEKLQDLPVEWLGAHDRDEVVRQLEAEPGIVCVVMGAGLDDAIRGELIGRHRRAPAGHPDPPQGAQLRARRHGALRAPDRRGHGAGAGGGLMAVPALKLDGAEALLAAWPEPAGEAGWARAARARAARRLAERGAPVRRDEYWKFTDPTGLTVAAGAGGGGACAVDEEPMFDGTDRLRLVFVDGVFAPELSDAARDGGRRDPPAGRGAGHGHHTGRASSSACSRARGQEPVDRPLAALNTARATRRGGDPRHRPGGAADQPRLSPQRRRRRTRWCTT